MIRHPTKPGYAGIHSADAHKHFNRHRADQLPLMGPCIECPDRKQCNADHSTCPSELRTMNKDGLWGHIVWVKETTAVIATLED